MADGWVALMLTWGPMFITAKCNLTRTCCTSHALSSPVHVGGAFSTSWVLHSLASGICWTIFEMLIPGKGTLSLNFYLPIALGTHGLISWEMSRFQMLFCAFLISQLSYLLPILNCSFSGFLSSLKIM